MNGLNQVLNVLIYAMATRLIWYKETWIVMLGNSTNSAPSATPRFF